MKKIKEKYLIQKKINYKKYQDNLSDENTKKLDELILNKMNNDQKKYENFLETFYKIIYLKYLKQTDE